MIADLLIKTLNITKIERAIICLVLKIFNWANLENVDEKKRGAPKQDKEMLIAVIIGVKVKLNLSRFLAILKSAINGYLQLKILTKN